VIRPRLVELGEFIRTAAGAASRVAVDSSAVLERDLAARAGLGWVGKNTNLLTPSLGSYFFIGIVLTTAALPFDQREPDRCGTCTACLDACPTRAFVAPYVLDARRCISYLTIEHRGDIAGELAEQIGEWVFGCDVCQEVCPYNRADLPAGDARFAARPLGLMPPEVVAALTEAEYQRLSAGMALARAHYDGLRRNAIFALGRAAARRQRPLLERLAADPSPLVSEAARWALADSEGAT
jgi:epoxyqueuosine reductase